MSPWRVPRGARRALQIIGLLAAVLVALVGLRALARARGFQLFGSLIASVPITEPRVALSFDDGPTAATLDTLLDVLRSRSVHATFFVIGAALAEHPMAGRRLVAAGHELGNHTFSHRRMVFVGPRTVREEIERTDSLIRAVGHSGPIHFRPPYGAKLVALPLYLEWSNRTTVMWDAEPDSYPDVAATPEGIVRHVLARVRPGSIILLHPWYPVRATSLAAVGPLIDSLHARGYRVGPVRDLLAPASGARATRLRSLR